MKKVNGLLMVLLFLYCQASIGQTSFPKSMVKASVQATLTDRVKVFGSEGGVAVGSSPCLGAVVETSYRHGLPCGFGINAGIGAILVPSGIRVYNTESVAVDKQVFCTPLLSIPVSVEKIFTSVCTRRGWTLVGELGAKADCPFYGATYGLGSGREQMEIVSTDGYLVQMDVAKGVFMSCFAKIGLMKLLTNGNALRFDIICNYALKNFNTGNYKYGMGTEQKAGLLEQKMNYVGLGMTYCFGLHN